MTSSHCKVKEYVLNSCERIPVKTSDAHPWCHLVVSLFLLLTLFFLFVEAGQSQLFNLVALLDDVSSVNKTQTGWEKIISTKLNKKGVVIKFVSTMDRGPHS